MSAPLGNLQSFFEALGATVQPSLSFLDPKWTDVTEWSKIASTKLFELLLYNPAACPLDSKTIEVIDCGSYVREKIEFSSSSTHRIGGYLLVPKNRCIGPLPAVVALHDHGAYYLRGKEKLVQLPDEPSSLMEHKARAYGGRSIADELAKLNYVVCVIDAFYWGDRRLKLSEIDDRNLSAKEMNQRLWDKEEVVMRHLLAIGASWMGLVSHDDRRTVEYLLSRSEVDPKRIGCLGLSFGAMRTNLLFATDSRIRAGISVGWGCDWSHLLPAHLHYHSVSQAIPGLAKYFELTDVMAIGAQRSFMLMQCKQDMLFPLSGMQASAERAAALWKKAGNSSNFKAAFYDAPHQFNLEMQADAFAWLEAHLAAK